MAAVSVKRTTSILFALRVLRMLMSLVTVTLTAKYFGVSVEKDAWLLVTALFSSIVLLIWGPINETFRAKFVFLRESDGEPTALRSAWSLVSGVIVVTLVLIAILALFASPISHFAAFDLKDAGIAWFFSLFMVLLPTLLIDELNNIFSSILNAYDIFYLPELVGTFTTLGYIGILIWVAPTIGIYAMVAGQYLSTLTLVAVLLIVIRRKGLFKTSWLLRPDFKLLKPFILYALPFFFPYAVGQLNAFGERWLAGILGVGNVSILDYGRRFTMILQTVLGGILTTVMVPLLAKAHIAQDNADFIGKLKEHLSVVYGIMLVAIPFLVGAAYPLCDFLFHRGSVTAADIEKITLICQLYAFAFLCVVLYIIFGNVLLASEQGKPYAFWGVMAQLVVLALNFGFVSVCGLIIFPLSLGAVHLVSGIIMWRKSKAWLSDVAKTILKSNALILAACALLYLCSTRFLPAETLPNLCLSTLIAIATAIILSPVIGINPWKILQQLKKK